MGVQKTNIEKCTGNNRPKYMRYYNYGVKIKQNMYNKDCKSFSGLLWVIRNWGYYIAYIILCIYTLHVVHRYMHVIAYITIIRCLGLGHETMVCAVCLPILWLSLILLSLSLSSSASSSFILSSLLLLVSSSSSSSSSSSLYCNYCQFMKYNHFTNLG